MSCVYHYHRKYIYIYIHHKIYVFIIVISLFDEVSQNINQSEIEISDTKLSVKLYGIVSQEN